MPTILSAPRYLLRFCSTTVKEMKYLNVAEKNDAAKTIAGLLSNGSSRRREGLSVYNKIYEFETNVLGRNAKMVMTSVSGHLLNYEFVSAYRNWQTCDPEQLFDAPIRKGCDPDNEKIRKTIEREIKSCQGLIVWTDCDREGENIGFEVIEVCKSTKPNISVYRAKFSEITATSVRRALSNLTQPDERQNQAVDVRQELDLRTGAAFTRFQTLRLQRTFPSEIADNLISYGSCQIPTLGFVAQRYKEAEEFVPEPFWKLKVTHTIDDLTVDFIWARNRLFDKEACEDYLLLCLAEPLATVENVTVKPKNKWRPQPMDTVTLEKLGSRKLRINAKRTMQIAEKLYTQGIISYPRTETNSFSKDINLRSLVEQHTPHPEWGNFATRVLEWGPNPRNGQKSDEAHPPIHPTKYTTGLNGDEQRVYELIVRHFLACVSKDATGSETIVNITIAGEKFSANGLVIFERNYLDVYPYEKWNAKQIHHYEIGQTFEPTEISMQEGMTTAPPLLTEADLIALMEKHGIGTDATHAEHIHTIKERGYIGEVDRGLLVPGTIGMGLYEGYDAMELPLAQPKLRADFEVDLKKICAGEKNAKDVLREQIQHYKQAYRLITEKFKAMYEKMAKRLNTVLQESLVNQEITTQRVQDILKCPKCSKYSMALKMKKDGSSYFIGCLGFPECKNVIWLPDDIKDIKVTNEDCRKCGPGYKIIQVKLSQMNYLPFLNATSSTYKTCMVCDSKFCELFNINIDCVKRVGPIVSDRLENSSNMRNTNRNRPGVVDLTRTNNTNSNTNNSRYQGWFSNTSDNSGNRPSRPNSNRDSSKRKRNDDSLMAENMFADDDFDDILIASDWNAVPDSDNRVNNSNSSNRELGSSSTNSVISNNTGNTRRTNEHSSSWGTSSNANNFTDNEHPTMNRRNNSNYNSSANNTNRNEIVKCNKCNEPARLLTVKKDGPNKGRDFYVCSRNQSDKCDFFQWADEQPTENRPNNSNYNSSASNTNSNQVVKCNKCNEAARLLTVKKDGPNKGRDFYTCSRSPNDKCDFFQWADENAQPNFNSTNNNFGQNSNFQNNSGNATSPNEYDPDPVLCTHCNQPAKSLVARRDGPNQGRSFFVCSKQPKPCQFFKWADDNDEQGESWGSGSNYSSSWGSGSNRNNDQPSTSWGQQRQNNAVESGQAAPKKRKCGLCRQEGHTKLKCPRKDEFGL